MNEELDVRTRMQQALSKFNIKQVDVAREAGIHHSTLSLWLQGKVKGHHIGIQDTLNQWLQNLYSGKHRYTTLNKTTDKQFILTPPALNIKKKQRPLDNEDILIPVHLDLDLEIEGRKYKEVFCWNVNDPYFTPEEYAKLLVVENGLLAVYQGKIVQAIRKAISQHYRARKPVKSPSSIKNILLDVKIGNICLKDRFQWNINNIDNCPEDFAYQLCKQMNLNGQFMSKISHQIRQQIQYYRKSTSTTIPNSLSLGINQIGSNQLNPSIVSPSINTQMMDMKKSTRHLVELSGNYSYNGQPVDNTVTTQNYIRLQSPYEWEPEVQILDAGQVRKFQSKEERKNRYARRTTR